LWRLLLLTCGEQDGTGISEAVKNDIFFWFISMQARDGLDEGIAFHIADSLAYFEFETCEKIELPNQGVRCMACL